MKWENLNKRIEKYKNFLASCKVKNFCQSTAFSYERCVWSLILINDYRNVKIENFLICIWEVSFLCILSLWFSFQREW